MTAQDHLFRELENACRVHQGDNSKPYWDSAVTAAKIWKNAVQDVQNGGDLTKSFFQAGVLELDEPGQSPREWEKLALPLQEELKQRLVHQVHALYNLTAAARLAATNPSGCDREVGEMISIPEDRSSVTQRRVWIQTFLGARVLAEAAVDFVVAHRISDTKAEGRLLRLNLEIVEGQNTSVGLHPLAAMNTQVGCSFSKAIIQGFTAAQKRLCMNEQVIKGSGRYRITAITPTSEPETLFSGHVDGASAGGSAFRGWWHALQKLTPDREVVVLASLDCDSNGGDPGLNGVDDLEAKVKAIVRHGEHDTIAVANARDAGKVARQLQKMKPKHRFCVVDLSQPEPSTPTEFCSNVLHQRL